MEWLGLIPLILGIYIAVANWFCVFRGQSAVPLIGAALLAIGLQSFPITRPYVFLSVLDYGFLMIILALPTLARYAWETSSFRILAQFEARTSEAVYSLRLYKSKIFVIEADFHPRVLQGNQPILAHFGQRGRWHTQGDDIILEKYANDRRAVLRQQGSNFLADETENSNPTSDATSLHGLTFTIRRR